MRVLIGGGGTGGHLVPGIAIYQEFKKHGHKVFYVMSERDKAYNISNLLEEDERMVIELSGISRKFSLNTFKQLYTIFNVWRESFREIRKFNPDVIVVTGGYLSNIAALSGFILRKPLYILEQNSAAGITNRFWGIFAKKIFATFPSPKFMPSNKIVHTGNPLCYKDRVDTDTAKSFLGLSSSKKPVIGILGGSQGAKILNNIILNLLPNLIDMGYQIIWSLGTKEYERFIDEQKLQIIDSYGDDVKAFRFVDRMDMFWSASNFVIARSGAGTVTESLFFGIPSIFIPIYNSPDNHQYLNAYYLLKKGCATIIEEPQLTNQELLKNIKLVTDDYDTYQKGFAITDQDPAKNIVALIAKDLI